MLSPYLKLLRTRAAAALLITKFLAFLPEVALAIPLTVIIHAQTGSYKNATLAISAYTFTGLIAAPYLSRFAITRRSGPLFMSLGILHAIVLSLAIYQIHHWGFWPLFFFGLSGLTSPPLISFIRYGWQHLAQLTSGATNPDILAHGLENATTEVMFITGPLLASGALALGMAYGFLYAISIFTSLACVAWYFLERDHIPIVQKEVEHTSIWRLWPLLLAGTFWVTGWMCIELTTIAQSQTDGINYFAGIWLAVISAGALVGGLLYGAIDIAGKYLKTEICLSILCMNLFLILPLLGVHYTLLPIGFLLGLITAPAYAGLFVWADKLVKREERPAAYAYLGSAFGLGVAAAPLPLGILLDAFSPLQTFLVFMSVVSAISILLVLRNLKAPPANPDSQASAK